MIYRQLLHQGNCSPSATVCSLILQGGEWQAVEEEWGRAWTGLHGLPSSFVQIIPAALNQDSNKYTQSNTHTNNWAHTWV